MVKTLLYLLRVGRFSGFLGSPICRKFCSDFSSSKLLEIPLDLPPICRGFTLGLGGQERWVFGVFDSRFSRFYHQNSPVFAQC